MQPPCLLPDTVLDAHIDPIAVEAKELRLAKPGLPTKMFLQTSPELAMKQLLVGGAPSLYSLGPVFRGGEHGVFHRTEFTMLEWYECGGTIDTAIRLLAELATHVLSSHDCGVTTYREVFLQQVGIDPLEATNSELRGAAAATSPNLAVDPSLDRDDLLDLLLAERIQPTLGRSRPLILRDYPLSQAALAKESPDDPRCAMRFELFVEGVELANGYDELQDAEELVARAKRQNAKRSATNRPPLNVETGLVAAMREGLPQCAGVALGVDRLHMVKHGYDGLDGCQLDVHLRD